MFSFSQRQKPSLWRSVMSLFVLLTCIRVWVGPVPAAQPACAQIPDAGSQRRLALDEARRTNLLLSEIKQVLSTHTFNVRIEGADNTGADSPARLRRGPGGAGK